MRNRLLWIVIGVETLSIIALLGWATTHPRKAAAPAPATSTSQQTTTPGTTLHTPALAPVVLAQGLSAPTTITSTGVKGDTRLFVTEQAGHVRIVDSKGALSAPILDISSSVQNQGEMGLLGLAFHPKFASNHYIYVYYINKTRQTVVARYELDPTTSMAKPASVKVLLTLQQVYTNHKGGQLQFGPDGYLYIGIGDGGSGGDPDKHGQDLHTWFGKILRIDVDRGDPYSIPTSNPYARSTDKNIKPEIWASGLRNPWRFSFDRQTGDLFIADVGQNTYEEINLQPKNSRGGENYGWRCFEASYTYNSDDCGAANQYTSPIVEYAHADKRCSITGGYVYRGTQEPALVGVYMYADYCSGEIFYATKQPNTWQSVVGAKTTTSISTFGEDVNGEVYFADVASGTLYHLTDSAN